MTRDYALGIWRSVRTTFILFVVLVPSIIVLNTVGEADVSEQMRDLVPTGVGVIAFAGLIAEIARRLINHFAGENICRWRSVQ